MKKYINKLFEKLGYVPKDTYKTAREYAAIKLRLQQAILEHQKSSLGCKSRFRVSEHCIPSKNWVADGFLVEQICDKDSFCWIVKFFPYNGDKAYARLCAEELCEKLNEKY